MEEKPKKKLNVKKIILLTLGAIVILKILQVLMVVYVVQPVQIQGNAMSPNFNNGDKVVAKKIFNEIQRGDVVIFYHPKDSSLMFSKTCCWIGR